MLIQLNIKFILDKSNSHEAWKAYERSEVTTGAICKYLSIREISW